MRKRKLIKIVVLAIFLMALLSMGGEVVTLYLPIVMVSNPSAGSAGMATPATPFSPIPTPTSFGPDPRPTLPPMETN